MKRFIRVKTHDNFLRVLQELKRMITLYTKRSIKVEAKRIKRTITL